MVIIGVIPYLRLQLDGDLSFFRGTCQLVRPVVNPTPRRGGSTQSIITHMVTCLIFLGMGIPLDPQPVSLRLCCCLRGGRWTFLFFQINEFPLLLSMMQPSRSNRTDRGPVRQSCSSQPRTYFTVVISCRGLFFQRRARSMSVWCVLSV